jgi:hypothetical protein
MTFGLPPVRHVADFRASAMGIKPKSPGSVATVSYYLAIPQDLHDPQIKRGGFRVSKNTYTARRPSAWAMRGPAYHTELSKTLRSIPTY